MLVFRHDAIGQTHAPAALPRKWVSIISITCEVAWTALPVWRTDKPPHLPKKRTGLPLTYCPYAGNYTYRATTGG
jgi:hypothetical protein